MNDSDKDTGNLLFLVIIGAMACLAVAMAFGCSIMANRPSPCVKGGADG